MRTLKKLNIQKVYDLQNSSRTKFYKNILFPKANCNSWSSSETTLPKDTSKAEFDKNPVLNRFEHQLKMSGLDTQNTTKPNFSWSCTNIDNIKNDNELREYIVLFPFCSAHLDVKKWPYYNELIKLIINKFNDRYKIVVAPGPSEINDAKNIHAISILDQNKALNISQLSTLIKESSFVVANDTGPAHMSAHLGAKGLTLFGKHTTAFKVSIERENFKAIQVDDLKKLSVEKVFERMSIALD
jgi:ADP-heptose:LPS heptosyltransferase